MHIRFMLIAAAAVTAVLGGCTSEGDIVVEQGVGITALRTPCPAVGIPDYTGDITLFSPAGATTADALDITATMTNLRSQCDVSGDEVYTRVSFEVLAQRRDTSSARQVEIPYFSTVLRGGSSVVAKRIGTVTLNFAEGEARTQAVGQAGAVVDRAEATLPADIRQRITRRRRAGEEDAAIDPLTEPEVREAIARASFELLVGFQLSEEQLAYNATR